MIDIKCIDCGLLWKNIGSLKEAGILDGDKCPNCGGEVVILNGNSRFLFDSKSLGPSE